MAKDTKLLLMLGLFALLFGSLVWEDDNCGAERSTLVVQRPLDIFEKTTISRAEEVEATTIDVKGKATTVPFGLINDRWEGLKLQYQNGDCLFHFRTDAESWEQLLGSEGYILIRDGEAIDSIITIIS